jgi:hypothetical protein
MERKSVFIKELKEYIGILPKQTIKTLRGQALAGDIVGARKGLTKILDRKRGIYYVK